MDLKEAILSRRSIRSYKSDLVSEQTLKELFNLVKMSPSWANTQVWEFVLVTDKHIKDKLINSMPEGNPARKACSEAPIMIVELGIKGKSGFKKGEPMTNKGDNWYMYDAGIAMQTLCLAAHSMGLGTVILGLFDAEQAGKILNLPENIAVVAMTPIGYPAADSKCPPRKDISEFIYKDSYGVKKF